MQQSALLKPFGERLWIADGGIVRFWGMPFPTRMTVARLPGDRLWLHSPIAPTAALRAAVDALGRVDALVAPNSLHHLFVAPWQAAYPQARTFAVADLRRKRPDLRFDMDIDDAAPPAWNDEIESLLFRGSRLIQEAVFLHRPSRTLIVVDLIENFEPHTLSWPVRLVARLGGVLAPNGGTPRDYRASFLGAGRAQARACRAHVLAWQPERIVLAHGLCIESDATRFLRDAWSWLDE